MKYTRLTKEQLDELHPEFINFLASQSIDRAEWDAIKTKQPHIAEQEIDVFSDLIWEGVLNKTEYLESISMHHAFLFRCGDSHIHSFIVQSLHADIDLTTSKGIIRMLEDLSSDHIEIVRGSKPFMEDRNLEIFKLIRQGAVLSDGKLYQQVNSFVNG